MGGDYEISAAGKRFAHHGRIPAFRARAGICRRGKSAEAEKELTALREKIKIIPAETGFGNSTAHGVLKVAEEMLAGEIALSRGDKKTAIELLRKAVAAEDAVNYNEPPDWDLPVREWLGRALLVNGEYAEAEKVYRDDLAKHPRNGRALFGLAEALNKQGKTDSAQMIWREFEKAWEKADTKLTVEDYLYQSSNKRAQVWKYSAR